ncbi:hypothetical protein GCM10009789_51790 [Kribbella sancticallisti]|uniref:histidine kinase n=1 Tax=Kribbella sancticallisti TaxID=460087 RepID=A0ABN2E0Z8_9ACTN
MGLIAVKAGVANHVLKVRPEEVSDALGVIETTSREALVELRHMLGLLRDEPLPPPGGLAALPELADRVRSLGLEVDLQVRGTDRLPEGVELAVYRIVQECLTNVAKHSGASSCRVVVDADGHEVLIQVSDQGTNTSATAPAEGHGLIGIRERVSLYGGTLVAGRGPAGGFEVTAKLPYRSAGMS